MAVRDTISSPWRIQLELVLTDRTSGCRYTARFVGKPKGLACSVEGSTGVDTSIPEGTRFRTRSRVKPSEMSNSFAEFRAVSLGLPSPGPGPSFGDAWFDPQVGNEEWLRFTGFSMGASCSPVTGFKAEGDFDVTGTYAE